LAIGLPISRYAIRHGVDIYLLTRGAGFGYIGSTITSPICDISAVMVIPLVTHGDEDEGKDIQHDPEGLGHKLELA
ncbi:hypothetical protein AB9F41_38785, partial [Rhizobium leguminosarum]|uniref:hypothetical protein n=1 Tax=Rhizobium leguminosarum TaxID=384 RepID=UPI003F981C21